MKAIDFPLSAAIHQSSESIINELAELLDVLRTRQRIADMFHLPPMDPTRHKNVLDELFDVTNSTIDFCDNEAQIEVLKHHYTHEFSGTDQEVSKDYRDDSIIHKVVDDMPSTYRGREGAVHAWHDLSSHLDLKRGSCNVDLTHISVCRNHAQVHWKAESTADHMVLFGTDSFTFDDTNHIKMQTTVALSEK